MIVLVIFILLFGWTLIADRLTLYTSDASVRSFVVRIVPEISGKVTEVAVQDNQIVHTGDLLFRIDPTPFGIAVERTEAKLAAAGQAVGVSTAAVDAAQAQLVEQIAERANVREQAGRVFELVRQRVYPPAKPTRHGRCWTRPRHRCSRHRPRWSRRARRSAQGVPTTRKFARRWPHSSRRAST